MGLGRNVCGSAFGIAVWGGHFQRIEPSRPGMYDAGTWSDGRASDVRWCRIGSLSYAMDCVLNGRQNLNSSSGKSPGEEMRSHKPSQVWAVPILLGILFGDGLVGYYIQSMAGRM